MKNNLFKIINLGLGLSLLASSSALAHTSSHIASAGGVGTGLISGFFHPLAGADHLLALFALGIWAASRVTGQTLMIAFCCLVAMVAGFGLGIVGFSLPILEIVIAASVIITGLLVTTKINLGLIGALSLTAGLALFHGYAHGTEMTGNLLGFLTGFTTATIGLLGLGCYTGIKLAQAGSFSKLQPIIGGLIASMGAYLLATV